MGIKTKTSWQPGQSGNPGGRPKGSTNKRIIVKAIREALKTEVDGEVPLKTIANIVRDCLRTGYVQFPQDKKATQLKWDEWQRLFELVLKYSEGPAPHPVELSGPGGGSVEIALSRYAESVIDLSEDDFIGAITTTLDDFHESGDLEAEAEEP